MRSNVATVEARACCDVRVRNSPGLHTQRGIALRWNKVMKIKYTHG